jgi:hypothetical protein
MFELFPNLQTAWDLCQQTQTLVGLPAWLVKASLSLLQMRCRQGPKLILATNLV